MKTVFLILYLYHGVYANGAGKATGGPALTITQMPSLSACEVAGSAAKGLVDAARVDPAEKESFYALLRGQFAVYRCIEVAK